MPRDWNPNAPDAKQAFNDNKKAKPISTPQPVSKIELQKLEAQRKPPTANLAPKPPNAVANTATDNKSLEREKRIHHIKSQLNKNRSRSKNDFKQSRRGR